MKWTAGSQNLTSNPETKQQQTTKHHVFDRNPVSVDLFYIKRELKFY